MGDHFVLLVDRLLTESTLEAAIESRNRSLQATASTVDDSKVFNSSTVVDLSSPRKIVECRICQDEDEDSNMETPCSCCGSLEQFKPGYTAPVPPPLFRIGRIPLNLRANWDIYRRELNDSRVIAVVSTDHRYNEHSVSTTSSSIRYRTVAIVFMFLLILRHTLPVILSGNDENTFPLFMLLLPLVGIILPIYIMVKAVNLLLRHRQQQQVTPSSGSTQSDEETEHSFMHTQPHIVNVH